MIARFLLSELFASHARIITNVTQKRAFSSFSIYDQQERIQELDYKKNILDTMSEPKEPYKVKNEVIFDDPYRREDSEKNPHYQERYLGNYVHFIEFKKK